MTWEFPSNFVTDTSTFHQALDEHNARRSRAGLAEQNFSQLAEDERRSVLARAQAIKTESRPQRAEAFA